MIISSDWHIHSKNSCDSAALEMAEIVRGTAQAGILDYGVADHLHTPFNLPDIEKSREEYLACNPGPRFHFGIEVSCVSQWELHAIRRGEAQNPVYGIRKGGPPGAELAIGIGGEELDRLGVEYVIGGAHWPMYVPIEQGALIRDYHRQNMFLAEHPLVDIVAHPWWWQQNKHKDAQGNFLDPWLGDFKKIPRSMHDEFAEAVNENKKAAEINVDMVSPIAKYPPSLSPQYLEYLAYLKSKGVVFAMSSDCHAAKYEEDFGPVAELLESVGIEEDDLWALEARDLVN